jgi:hypothetical protein
VGGLFYYRYRRHDARRGRLLTRDPIGYAAGPNVYAYVGGLVTVAWDPCGLETVTIKAAVLKCMKEQANRIAACKKSRELAKAASKTKTTTDDFVCNYADCIEWMNRLYLKCMNRVAQAARRPRPPVTLPWTVIEPDPTGMGDMELSHGFASKPLALDVGEALVTLGETLQAGLPGPGVGGAGGTALNQLKGAADPLGGAAEAVAQFAVQKAVEQGAAARERKLTRKEPVARDPNVREIDF